MTDPGRGSDPLPPELAAVHVPEDADADDEAAIHAAIEAMDADDRFGGAALPTHSDADMTVDSGARRPIVDEANMGFGAEPRSIEELESSLLGDEQRRDEGVTREDERHGAGFLDQPPE